MSLENNVINHKSEASFTYFMYSLNDFTFQPFKSKPALLQVQVGHSCPFTCLCVIPGSTEEEPTFKPSSTEHPLHF